MSEEKEKDAPAPIQEGESISPAAAAPRASELAIFGGAKTLEDPYRDRWRRIAWRDVFRMTLAAARDDVTAIHSKSPIGRLEEQFCRLTGADFALTMNSGTATLHSAYFAAGVKPGDEVIVPSYTFYASAAPILQCGGIPVFCDIDPKTLTIDPEDVERRIGPKTKAVCAVHVWGNPARLDRLVQICRDHGLVLIEDCSHAHGATYQGRSVGTWGDIGCFSLQAQKAVCGGELGIAVTNNARFYDRMLALGHMGRMSTDQKASTFEIDNLCFGIKYRPHLYGVLMAMGALRRLGELNRRRRKWYDYLSKALKDCPALVPIETYPGSMRGGLVEFLFRYHPEHAGGWNRGAFVKALQAEGVPVYADRYTLVGAHARLLHEAPLFTDVDFSELGGFLAGGAKPGTIATDPASLPVSMELCDKLVALPPFTKVSEKYVRACVQAIHKVVRLANEVGDLRT
jgi:dTDP-4-amino-4,6-dideoxygalactose transaminase